MRRPRGYLGLRHETIGTDILAVYEALQFPEAVLGKDAAQRVRSLDPNGWYPIHTLLDLLETVSSQVGEASMRKIGRTLFKLSHEEKAKTVLRSARDLLHGMDGLYHAANRGEGIGGWKVLRFEPGEAVLEKTTPHHCVLEEGIVDAALRMLGVTAVIEQPKCFRRGDDACQFSLYSRVVDQRWTG